MRTTRLCLLPGNGLLETSHDLEQDEVAFVDRDWVTDAGPFPAMAVPRGPGAADMVAHAFARTALAAAHAGHLVTQDDPRATVRVTGTGVLASLITMAQGPRPTSAEGHHRPVVVIEATGRSDVVRDALGLAADLGTVILAGEPVELEATVDLYGQVHRRGLRVVGMPLDAPIDGGASSGAVDRLAAEALRHLSPWTSRTPSEDTSWWYCVESDASGVGPSPPRQVLAGSDGGRPR